MLLGEALRLAEEWVVRGLPVFPVAISWDEKKAGTSKRPLCEHGFKDATLDGRTVRLMFNKARTRDGETLGVGLWPGPAGYMFVDVDEPHCVELYTERELPATYTVTTCSGGRHYVYRKPTAGHVGTSCAFEEVDVIRADDGFVVAPGTYCPWGEWVSHDDFGADVADAPAELWNSIRSVGDRSSSTTGTTSHGYHATLAKLRSVGRHQDAEALRALCGRHGGHDPFVKGDEVHVTRPGKSAGTSATIGFVGPGVVKMFSSRWPPFNAQGRYIVGDDGLLVDESDSTMTVTGYDGEGNSASTTRSREPTGRDVLLNLVQCTYTIGRTEDERTYLVPSDGPNVALFGKAAKEHLARSYRATTGQTIGRSPLDEAWTTIEGLAFDVPKTRLPLRVATHDGRSVVDLGDTTGIAVIITTDGWELVDRSPVTFRRSKAMLPLPVPVPGGDVDELFGLLNITPADRDLVGAWLASTLVEEIPHPAAVLRGEQGTAKSSTARALSQLIDPCMASTQKPPRSEDEWAQSCSARWLTAVDNVSNVPEWWSDALCRTITGDGWLRRALYTDDDVVVTRWRRCVILNGISLGAALRSDLGERLVLFELERPKGWLTEAEVETRLEEMRPRVLGALLDRVARTKAALLDTEPVRDLRMADFATLLAGYDAANGTDALAAYRRRVDDAFDEAFASDLLAVAVANFMDDRQTGWQGTTTELLDELSGYRPTDERTFWPKNAQQLSSAMTRSAPCLRRVGIEWHRPAPQGHNRTRIARLTRISSPPASADADDADNADIDLSIVASKTRRVESATEYGQT